MPIRTSTLALALVGASLSLACAQIEQRIGRSEAGILERLKHHRVPGVSVAVVAHGELEWVRGYGLTSAGGRPVTPETLFQAASISKPVAALVVLRLVEQGRLSLDEDVNRWLRSWKVSGGEAGQVTLRRLLSHSAGLTVHGFRGYALGEEVPTLAQVLNGVAPANSKPILVDIAPGANWRYSGGGYVVIQQLVEDITGKPFPEAAHELVLEPLGMKHSTFEQPLPERLAGEAAVGHHGNGAPVTGRWYVHPEVAAAGLWTTPSDLARVVLELQSPKVLKRRTVDEMLTRTAGEYGLGFGLGERGGVRSFSHGGSNVGFKCMLFAFRDTGRGAIVMTNGDRGAALAQEILAGIAAEYGWPDY